MKSHTDHKPCDFEVLIVTLDKQYPHPPNAAHRSRRAQAAAFLAFVLGLVAFAPTRGGADPPEIGLNDLRISFEGGTGNTMASARDARVAYNPDLNEYLVVWCSFENFTQELVGQRLSIDGSPIGDSFAIASGELHDSAIAYNTTDRRYLVTWWDFDSEFVEGRMVTSTGGLFGPEFQIGTTCAPFGSSCEPALAYAAAGNLYLVVWYHDNAFVGTWDIFGQRLDGTTGLPLDVNPIPIGQATDPASVSAPALAYNPTREEFLVVWHGDKLINRGTDIFGQRILAASGAPVGANDFRISDMGDSGDLSFGGFNPAVAYNPTDDQYLVVWVGDEDIIPLVDDEKEIFGQRLDAFGFQIGPNDFRISDLGGSRESFFDGSEPSVVYHQADELFLVTWHGDDDVGGLVDGELEIFGQFLNRSGAPIGPNDFRISDLGGTGDVDFDAQNAAVASSSGEILVVWHGDDNENGLVDQELEIFGQRIDTSFVVFADDFETGDTSIWSNTVP